jgi:S-adenosylmethionine/arginine decarboxylase-like enzyme/uncharacterized protein with PQ loop repeat
MTMWRKFLFLIFFQPAQRSSLIYLATSQQRNKTTHSTMMDILVVGDILGTVGGIILGVCLIPEIRLIVKQQSAEDVSYTWLFLYLVGLVFTMAYLIIVEALVGWVTIVVEIAGVILIVYLKYKYAHKQAKKEARSETTKKNNLGRESYTEHDTVLVDIDRLTPIKPIQPSLLREPPYNWTQHRTHVVPAHDGGTQEHRGYHSMLDYVFTLEPQVSSSELAAFVFSKMQEACQQNSLRIVHRHLEVFADDQADATPPGFTSVCLIDESHVSAHCYSTLGMLALDVFTCGNIANSKGAAESLHAAISTSPLFEKIEMRAVSASRFPSRFTAVTKNDDKA